MKRKRMRIEDLRESQLNPENIHTDSVNVQYWRNGVMITAMMSIENARESIKAIRAFVITSQAVGSIDEEGFLNS